MFVNLVHFPPIKAGRDAEFVEWFEWSNRLLAGTKGFVRRQLWKTRDGGNYVGLVEYESYESFMVTHTDPIQHEIRQRADEVFEGNPTPAFYEVVIE